MTNIIIGDKDGRTNNTNTIPIIADVHHLQSRIGFHRKENGQ